MILCKHSLENWRARRILYRKRKYLDEKNYWDKKKFNLNKHRLENDMQNSRPKEGYTEQPECKNRKEGLRKLWTERIILNILRTERIQDRANSQDFGEKEFWPEIKYRLTEPIDCQSMTVI